MVSTLNEWIVSEYNALVEDQGGVVLLELNGLNIDESTALRNSVREKGAQVKVIKNRLAKVALEGAGVPISLEEISGTFALLVGDVESTIAASKAIEELAKKRKKDRRIHFLAAYLDGSAMDAAEAASIPSMPYKDTLRGMLCGALSGPARSIATLLSEVQASTARVVQARADQGDAA